MGAGGDDALGAALGEQLRCRNDGATRVDHVVDEDAGAPFDFADDARASTMFF